MERSPRLAPAPRLASAGPGRLAPLSRAAGFTGAWLGALLAGCVSARTQSQLDRSAEAAALRLPAAPPNASDPARLEATLGRGRPLERRTVVALAVARSPALAALAHRARALVHAGRAEGSLPSPELGLEAWNLPMGRPYALGEASMYMVELRQRFPPAGSLDARARAMAEEAAAALAEVSGEESTTIQRASDAFTEYALALRERVLLQEQLGLLRQMADAIRARYTTGGAGLGDLARLEVELAKARRMVARTEGEIARARSELNALLRRPAAAPLGEPRLDAPETVGLPLDELLARAAARRGSSLVASAKERASLARLDIAEAEASAPELMLGLGYWQDPQMRPGIGANLGMTLPWLWGPQRARVEQAREERAQQASERGAASLDAQAEVTELHARLGSYADQLRVLHRQGLPAARHAIDALSAVYATGSSSLLEWVDAARSALDLELEAAELQAELARSNAALERAVGEPLPRTPLVLEPAP